MINQALLKPNSIVIVGGSNNTKKPGGKIIKNILDGGYEGKLFVVNMRESYVQGIACFNSINELDNVDLAIIAIPAAKCVEVIETLAEKKNTRAFIILSAGFSEASDEGKVWEKEIVQIINGVKGCLLGPNCIGFLNANYHGVFTSPIPRLDPMGCDLISSSGATAVFIMEAGIGLGLRIANVYSVGNSAQLGVEEVLEYMDNNYNPETDSAIKLLYLESVNNPEKLLKHASSLIKKGVKIAAIKAGSTEAGSRAAASHTGALASSDLIVRALFKKAGIVYCSSREELISVASIFKYKVIKGKNIGIITHAGGSAVMLTDTLISNGLEVPEIKGEHAKKLLGYLHAGSSVKNPIDFLATGNAEQLGIIIDYCEKKFDHIDAMIVVFGSPGLFNVHDAYNVLNSKLKVCTKPIYPVLPSVVNAQEEITNFLEKGNINFPDEVVLGEALAAIFNTNKKLLSNKINTSLTIDLQRIREVIKVSNEGFLDTENVGQLLDAAGIDRVREYVVNSREDLLLMSNSLSFPVAMKVVGPIHKTDVNGVILNIIDSSELVAHFDFLMKIDEASGVLIQPMISGYELFVGVKKEIGFGHIVLCGLGGIFIDVLKDFSSCLTPVSEAESIQMIRSLKGYKLINGIRGKEGVDERVYSEIIQRISLLVDAAPEIVELDINPLMGNVDYIKAVDTRIKIKK
jgi:acetyltransferase